MAQPRPPRRNDDRTILHFDYDCFYAQVVQNRSGGALAGKCVGVTQKSILATCNYEARRRGVRKLMRIADARRVCPELILVDGEDLSPFRDVSKQLYRLVCTAVGPDVPVERLGLDEVFVDATTLIEANVDRVSRPVVRSSSTSRTTPVETAFFHMPSSTEDAPRGFTYSPTCFSGHVVGDDSASDNHASPSARSRLRLLLGSHLAVHLRHRLEHDAGYTSSAGIATSKVLAKLAGRRNKPANQTTLLSADSGDDSAGDATVLRFMDVLPLRSVPGIGFKTSLLLRDYFLAAQAATSADGVDAHSEGGDKSDVETGADDDVDGHDERDSPGVPSVTVADVRMMSGMSPSLLDSILGANRSKNSAAVSSATGTVPSGPRVWGLLHGADDTPVRGGRDLPTQISIEDTYAGPRQGTLRPDGAAAIAGELRKLTTSLLRRMHIDLLGRTGDKNDGADTASTIRTSWLIRPRTLRLTLRAQCPQAVDNRAPENYYARMSRSVPLPGFALSLTTPPEQIVERLVTTSLVPMFRKLAASVQAGAKRTTSKATHSSVNTPPWTVGLLNVCVANMAPVASSGDDIVSMFKRQDDRHSTATNIHEATLYPSYRVTSSSSSCVSNDGSGGNGNYDSDGDADDHSDTALDVCIDCGRFLPLFAREAHARYHLLGD